MKMSKLDKILAGAFVILCISLAVWCYKTYLSDLHNGEKYLYDTYGLEASNVIKDNDLQDTLLDEGSLVEWYYLGGARIAIRKYNGEYYGCYYDKSGVLLPSED